MNYIDLDDESAIKAKLIADLRRSVLAAMETGNEGRARTIIVELREYDFAAANKLRAEVVAAYGTDI